MFRPNQSSSAQCDNAKRRLHDFREYSGFNLSKLLFPLRLKEFGNGAAGFTFDLTIQINKCPSQSLGQSFTTSGFSGSHESTKKNARATFAHVQDRAQVIRKIIF